MTLINENIEDFTDEDLLPLVYANVPEAVAEYQRRNGEASE